MERLDEAKLRAANDAQLRRLRRSCKWSLGYNLSLSAWITAVLLHDWWEYTISRSESLEWMLALTLIILLLNAVCLRDYVRSQEDLQLIEDIMEER